MDQLKAFGLNTVGQHQNVPFTPSSGFFAAEEGGATGRIASTSCARTFNSSITNVGDK
jgi:hypothetical protein